jgi:hypothetical protein
LQSSPKQHEAERDSAVYSLDACDSHGHEDHAQCNHTHSHGSHAHAHGITALHGSPNLILTRSVVASSSYLTKDFSQEAEVYDVIYDLCPFLFKGPAISVAVFVTQALRMQQTHSKLASIQQKYAHRPWHFPWALIFIIASIALLIYSTPFFLNWVEQDIRLRNNGISSGVQSTSSTSGMSKYELEHITDSVLRAIRNDNEILNKIANVDQSLKISVESLTKQILQKDEENDNDLKQTQTVVLDAMQSKLTSFDKEQDAELLVLKQQQSEALKLAISQLNAEPKHHFCLDLYLQPLLMKP